MNTKKTLNDIGPGEHAIISELKSDENMKRRLLDIGLIRGTKVEYEEISAHCPTCKRELYVPELHDLNCMNREKAYQQIVKEINNV